MQNKYCKTNAKKNISQKRIFQKRLMQKTNIEKHLVCKNDRNKKYIMGYCKENRKG